MLTLASRSAATIPYGNASAYFYTALESLKSQSVTAAAIIKFIENAAMVQISVLVSDVEGAFGPFSMEWAFTGPCIVWTPGKSFSTRGASITGYRPASGAPIISGRKAIVVYPAEIVLIHELGHAKQYIEDPGIFARQGPGGIVAGSLTTAQIEADNLRRHEHPVCRDYKLLQRQNYTDFEGFNDVAVPTTGRLY